MSWVGEEEEEEEEVERAIFKGMLSHEGEERKGRTTSDRKWR